MLDPNVADIEIRQTVFKLMSRLDLETSVQQIDALVRPPEDVYYKELRTSYRRVCRFLPTLLKTVVFRASPAGEPLIEAIDYLKTLDGDKKKATAKPPLDIVDATWRGYVVCDGKVDLQAYTFCFLDRLRKGLRRRDVFVTTSVRYADPRIGLLVCWRARPGKGRDRSYAEVLDCQLPLTRRFPFCATNSIKLIKQSRRIFRTTAAQESSRWWTAKMI